MAVIEIMEAAIHLRLNPSEPNWDAGDEAADLALKLEMAEAIVLDYLKTPDAYQGSDEEVPFPIRAAMLLVLSDLWEHRAGSANDDVFLSRAVKSLLHRFRDPALA
jgi:hypothetical protein